MKTENIAETIQINEKTLICHHCGNTTFFTIKGRIVTIAQIKWGYEELKRPTTCYVCSVCNNINAFLDK